MSIADALITLHLPKDYSEAMLRWSFFKKRGEHHPDRGGDAQEFIKIQEAYDTLTKKSPNGQIIYVTLRDLKNGCTEIVDGKSVIIPPGCSYGSLIDGYEVRLRLPPDISIDKSGNLTESVSVSPFTIIKGGFITHTTILDGECRFYLAPCAGPSPIIKLANHGVWKYNGDRTHYYLRLIPDFKPILEYSEEDIAWLRNLLITTPINLKK